MICCEERWECARPHGVGMVREVQKQTLRVPSAWSPCFLEGGRGQICVTQYDMTGHLMSWPGMGR